MKYGDKITLQIEKVDRKGRGLGQINGRPVGAYFCVPGETVEGTFYARKQGVKLITTEKIVRPSPYRVAAPCPYAGRCGGCLWQQFDYKHQLELKRELINRALEAGGLTERIRDVIPCPSQTYYRNRMDYCVSPKGEVGLKEPGRWNAWLDLEDCYLLSPDAVKALNAFRAYIKETGLEPWDADRQKGYVRYLVIREGKNTDQRLLTVVTSAGDFPDPDGLVKVLAPFATTIYHGVNPTVTDLSLAAKLTLLHGQPLLEEKIAGRTFRIHPNSFFQTNTLMAEKLLATVAEYLEPTRPQILLDMYCGVGFFGIGLSDRAEQVIGIELDEQAIVMARENAARNGLTNATYHAAKAESLIWENEKPDTVIVDPPRAGLHPKVAKKLLERAPERLVYVSCNYESFVRDFAVLRNGYRITEMRALDLFPHSPHVELVTLLMKMR